MMYSEKIRSQILNGCLADFRGHLYGVYQGYHISVQMKETQYDILRVKINASSEIDINNANLAQFLMNQKNISKRIIKVQVYPNVIMLQIKVGIMQGKIPEILNTELMPVISYLASNGYRSGCEQCGSTDSYVSCCEVNGDARTLCRNCLTQLEAALQNNREQKRAKKSNLVPGLVGAFLGALIGVVLWVLVGKLGYIISWVAIIMEFCALKGYEKFGGSLDLKGLIGSLVIVFVLIYFANRLTTAWIVYDALKEMGWSFSDCFQQLNMIMDLSGVTNLYYRDLAVGYGMTVVFGIFPAIGLFRSSRGEYTIR